jgi:hypothetical protein
MSRASDEIRGECYHGGCYEGSAVMLFHWHVEAVTKIATAYFNKVNKHYALHLLAQALRDVTPMHLAQCPVLWYHERPWYATP